MTLPEFALADPASPAWRSPLRRALPRPVEGVSDVSALVDERQVAVLGPAAGVAGIEIDRPDAERLLRRLTDLDLRTLPAVGAVAHVRALVVREGGGRYRLWFGQEYSDYVAEVVLDAAKGLS